MTYVMTCRACNVEHWALTVDGLCAECFGTSPSPWFAYAGPVGVQVTRMAAYDDDRKPTGLAGPYDIASSEVTI